jgi:hypothetical protein
MAAQASAMNVSPVGAKDDECLQALGYKPLVGDRCTDKQPETP